MRFWISLQEIEITARKLVSFVVDMFYQNKSYTGNNS